MTNRVHVYLGDGGVLEAKRKVTVVAACCEDNGCK
jgi:hypothetical protein